MKKSCLKQIRVNYTCGCPKTTWDRKRFQPIFLNIWERSLLQKANFSHFFRRQLTYWLDLPNQRQKRHLPVWIEKTSHAAQLNYFVYLKNIRAIQKCEWYFACQASEILWMNNETSNVLQYLRVPDGFYKITEIWRNI